ncbi:MAG: YqaJ viral recombinase family protein [Ruminococcus sp.]|nr:YqaJ viral recombinase family protein [Ruminococcus sp.]
MQYELVMTVKERKDRQKWLEVRNTGIGGSDAACILGLSKWKSAFQLWNEKTHKVEPEDLSDNEFIYWGNYFEEGVAKWFSEKTGKQVRRQGLIRSKEYPFMLASVDRMVIGENAGLECKTASDFKKSEWEGGEIPAAYYVQCQHYMAVTGCDKWYIACLIGGNKPIYKEVPRNEEEIKALIEAEKFFWERNVVAKELPSADGSDACTKAILNRFPGDKEIPAVDMNSEYDLLCHDLNILKQEKSKLEKIITEKENKLKLCLGNSTFGRTASFNIYYKCLEHKTFNEKQLAKDYPDIHARYVGRTPYRRLEIKGSKARTGETF